MTTPTRAPLALTPSLLDALTQRLQELMAEHHVPGVAVGLLTPEGPHELCLGVTNVENSLPVTPDTLFQIGSTTKTVTATALMRLVEEGRVDLDAPVRTYLPDLRLMDEDAAARVTVRQLLNHTGGWVGDYFENTGNGDDALARIVANLVHQEQVTPLGEVWSYNNAAFYIAGRVIEVMTGETYEAAARRLVLDPLGMQESFFFQDDVMTRSFVVGHIVKDGQPMVARPWGLGRNTSPAGGLASSVRDQLTYARFHLGDGTTASGERLLTPESMQLMQTPTVSASGGREMGVSWFVRDQGGIRFVQHGGATNGQMSAFVLAPELGFAFTSLTNADHGHFLNQQLEGWVWEHLLNLPPEEPAYLDVEGDMLDEVVGRYLAFGTFGGGMVVSRRGQELELEQMPEDTSAIAETEQDLLPPAPVRFYAPDRMVVTGGVMKGARLEVLRGTDGRVQWLRAGRVMRREQE
ncbi:serine hydrolase domain-containing protein [Deinococcus apachensis]|uniref:serine hydrolase domain-containing protein n=1 Tax=Deinococcus apachensis TaxID=309886 RepID=UPI000368749D|nr:serine hydrolase domain-containing protein [Deinococcus apachensis]